MKTLYTQRMIPFFKGATSKQLDETKEIKALNLDAPLEPITGDKEPEAPAKGAKGKAPPPPKSGQKDARSPLDKSKNPSSMNADESSPEATERSGKAKKLMTETKNKAASYRFTLNSSCPPKDVDDEDLEMWQNMRQEHLPGPTKTKWSLKYKNDTDQAIEAKLGYHEAEVQKRRTKGLFPIQTATNAGNWLVDKEWQKKANSLYKSLEMKREDFEM